MYPVNTLKLISSDYPNLLREIPDSPKQLYVRGNISVVIDRPCIAIVGSRRVSPYGKQVTAQLAHELAASGVIIVSGLAFGVDAIAHLAALEAGGQTIAVLPCGLDRVYPASHTGLANRIIEQGGALVSEYPIGSVPFKMNFIARNRIVSGLSDGVLITEAAAKSGTLHTANFALEQGRTVMAVPGNITSPLSEGTNNLIKTGATPVTNADDVLQSLGLERTEIVKAPVGESEEEVVLLKLLAEGVTAGADLLSHSGLQASVFNTTLTMLEIRGQIRPLGAGHWSLR